MSSFSAQRTRALLRTLRGRRVLVLGDVMLDQFIWGKVARISPEAPVPVVEVVNESFHVGGAGNVARNIRALGGEAVLVGVVGRDIAGERVHAELATAGVVNALVTTGNGRPTTMKTRIIAHQQQLVRADREQDGAIPPKVEAEILGRIKDALPACRALLVSDYQKGVITPRVMKQATALARKQKIPVLVDPKVRHFPLYRGVSLVTPNQYEAEQATGIRIRNDATLKAAGEKIQKHLRCDAALITRGEMGMSLFTAKAPPVHVPTAARQVFDVTGAGDTVIATFGLGLAAGAALSDLAWLANFAAGVVVGKVGTATASPEEIVRALESIV
jgi:D-glycero-beta-D-manno-heptose-7-phosphate kinase